MLPLPRPVNTYLQNHDVNYSSVSVLLHMDGANGGSTFVDNGPSALTVTRNNNAITDTGTVKYGTAAGNFLNSGSNNGYLTFSNDAGFALPGDFTVEAWCNWSNSANALNIYGGASINAGVPWFNLDPTGQFAKLYVNNVVVATGAILVSTGSWHHVAFSRTGTSLKIFIDGVLDSTTVMATSLLTTGGACVGAVPGFNACRGYLDDVRITKGVGRYTGTFTPPTKAFSNF